MPEVNEVDTPEVAVTPEQELADFNSGFNDDAPTETPAPVEEPKVEPEAPAAPEPKIKSLTEDEYKKLLDSAASIEATLEKRFGTAFGKIGGIERTIQQLQSMPAGQTAEVSQEDMAALKEYGDELPTALATALNKALAKVKVTSAAPAFDEAALEPVISKRVDDAVSKVEQKLETKALARMHSDFKEVFADTGFEQYRQSLPDAERQTLNDSWDADFIGGHITKYKASKAPPVVEAKPEPKPNTRKELLAASVTPRGTSAAVPGKKTEMDEFLEGFRSK